MPPCSINDLGHFCFRHFVGEHAAYAHTVLVDMKHDPSRVFARLIEELLKNVDDEFHRRVIVVE